MPGKRLVRACARVSLSLPWASVLWLCPSLPLSAMSAPFSPKYLMDIYSWFKTQMPSLLRRLSPRSRIKWSSLVLPHPQPWHVFQLPVSEVTASMYVHVHLPEGEQVFLVTVTRCLTKCLEKAALAQSACLESPNRAGVIRLQSPS